MGAAEFQKATNATDDTMFMYSIWENLLTHWNHKINLVSPSTISNFWLRHALDSHQLTSFIPKATKTILDMGAGAGFPGLAFAIHAKHNQNGQHVTLVESNGKKCNFLRAVIRELGLPATVLQARAETLPPKPYDVITARAFAPLPKLLEYSLPFWVMDNIKDDIKDNAQQTTAIFPKGEHWQDEVTAARKDFTFDLTTTPSQTNDQAKILSITNLRRNTGEGI